MRGRERKNADSRPQNALLPRARTTRRATRSITTTTQLPFSFLKRVPNTHAHTTEVTGVGVEGLGVGLNQGFAFIRNLVRKKLTNKQKSTLRSEYQSSHKEIVCVCVCRVSTMSQERWWSIWHLCSPPRFYESVWGNNSDNDNANVCVVCGA